MNQYLVQRSSNDFNNYCLETMLWKLAGAPAMCAFVAWIYQADLSTFLVAVNEVSHKYLIDLQGGFPIYSNAIYMFNTAG